MCSPLTVVVGGGAMSLPLVVLLLPGPNRHGHMLCQSSNEVEKGFPCSLVLSSYYSRFSPLRLLHC